MKRIKLLTSSSIIATMILTSIMPAFAYTKDETVYAKLKTNGDENKVVVSEHLKNDHQEKQLNDSSSLTEIRNVNGDEKYKKEGQTITWETTDGNDIYYQGNTKAALPISMEITYKLNGKEMKIKDMLGKKGNVEIKIDYTNHEKKIVDGQELYVPFVITTGTMLPTEKNSQVEVSHGKVMNNGTHNIVVAIAAPGLGENFDHNEELEKLNSISIKYTTKKFELNSIMSVASPSLLSEADLDFSQLDNIYSNVDKLTSSYVQLIDGGTQLLNGIKTVNQKMAVIINGSTQLKAGISQISEGSNQLVNGSSTLVEGIDHLNVGAKQLYSGVKTLANKLPELTEGISKLEYAASVLDTAIQGGTYTDPTTGKQYKLENKMTDNVTTITNTLSQISAAANQLPSSTEMQSLKMQLTNLANYLNSTGEGQQYLPVLQQLNSLISNLNSLSSLKNNQNTLTQAATELTISANILSGLNNQLNNGVQALKEGTTTLIKAVGSDESQEGTLLNGASQVSGGLENVKDKVPAVTKGLNQLSQGIEQLSAGADQLVNGTKTLKLEGTEQLENGANHLVSGMVQFQDEGLNKITNILNNIVKKDVNKTKKLTQLSKNYKTFAGSKDDVDAKTKFIMIVDAKSKKS